MTTSKTEQENTSIVNNHSILKLFEKNVLNFKEKMTY